MLFFIKNISKNSLIAQILIFSLCAYILFAGYLDLLPSYPLYDEKRINQIVLLGLISIASLIFFHRDVAATLSQLPASSKYLLLTALALGVSSTVVHNTHYQQSLLEIGLFGLLFVSVLSVASTHHALKRRFHNIILACLLITACLSITIVTIGYIASFTHEALPLLPYELFLNFANVRFFNQLQSWTLPLIVLPIIYWRFRKPWHKSISIFAATGWWWLLFVSGGRGALLGICVALVLTMIIYKTHARLWLKWQCISASSGFFLYVVLFYILPTSNMMGFSALGEVGSASRSYIWLNSWKLLQNNLLLGIGPINFACVSTNYDPAMPAHPHNALIQIAVEWGLPVATIVIFLFVWGCWCWIKKDRLISKNGSEDKEHIIFLALFASLIGASVHALFSGIIIMPHSQVMMVIILGWMLGIYFQPPKQTTQIPFYTRSMIITTAILISLTLISLVCLFMGMYPTMSTINYENSAKILLPRFWLQGQFCR